MTEETKQFDIAFIQKLQKKAQSVELKNILKKLMENKPLSGQEKRTLIELEEKHKEGQAAPERKTGKRPAGEFQNRLEVYKYLEREGWKLSQSAFYNHCNEGRLRPDKDGTYTLKAVERYARVHLGLKEVGQKIGDEELQRKKVMAEVAKLTEQARLAQIKRMAEEGKYIERDQFDLEMAARAGVLEAGLRGAVQARAGEWVVLVEGSESRIGDLVRDMLAVIDQALNEFATVKEFEVLFQFDQEEQ